jgi:hypothetical protein
MRVDCPSPRFTKDHLPDPSHDLLRSSIEVEAAGRGDPSM